MTLNELYERFSQAEQWRRLAAVCRNRVRDIILKPYGETDADTLTRDRLSEWLTKSNRRQEDTVPVESVINHMMQWAAKWKPKEDKPKAKKDAKADTKLRLHSGRDASGAETNGQPKEEPQSDSSCGRRRPVRDVRPTEPEEHHQVSGHARDKAPRASKPHSEGKTRRKRTETKAQPKASGNRTKERKAEPKPKRLKPEKVITKHPTKEGDVQQKRPTGETQMTMEEWQADTRYRHGTIEHDTSSKGWKNGKRVFKDCWRAVIMVNGQRYRHRAETREECREWLKAVNAKKILPTDNKADWWRMEQRKDEEVRIDEIIVSQAEESVLLYDYHQTKDLTKISDYVVQRLLPHMTYYCAHTLNFGKDRTLTASRQAIALLLTRITAGRPVLNFTSTCKRMLRVHKDRGNFFYYENAPKEVKMVCNRLDLSALADVWKVTKDRRI